jgi:hypothetical protein
MCPPARIVQAIGEAGEKISLDPIGSFVGGRPAKVRLDRFCRWRDSNRGLSAATGKSFARPP